MFKVKNVYLIVVLIVSNSFMAVSQTAESHKVMDSNLKKSSYKKLIKQAMKSDVIFFGEMHDDPISHWLQLKLLKDISQRTDVVLGLEMFERDNQEALTKYALGEIDLETFQKEARLWNNYQTDYDPLVVVAKERKIPVIATNVPRSYASMVYKEGFEVINNLVPEEKKFLAPLPIDYDPELPGYKNMVKMVEGHGGANFPKAQAIKDATMAYSISESFEAGKKYIHVNGKYHSDNKEGIIWYLNRYQPELKIMTISTIMQGDQDLNKGIADFIIVVDQDMGKTF